MALFFSVIFFIGVFGNTFVLYFSLKLQREKAKQFNTIIFLDWISYISNLNDFNNFDNNNNFFIIINWALRTKSAAD